MADIVSVFVRARDESVEIIKELAHKNGGRTTPTSVYIWLLIFDQSWL